MTQCCPLFGLGAYAPKVELGGYTPEMERTTRIELASTDWQSVVLPLYDVRMAPGRGYDPLSERSKLSVLPLNEPGIEMARSERIKLPSEGSEPSVLSLNELRIKWLSRRESNAHHPN